MTELQYKLSNFPPVFVVSVQSSVDRRRYVNQEFVKHGIDNVYYSIFDLWEEDKYIVSGRNLSQLHIGSYGPVTSHLLTNKYWTQNTDYEYVIVAEDDISFDFVKYWNFTWRDFLNALPEDWELVQLSTMREFPEEIGINFRERHNADLGCQIYLVKRNYAENVVSRYCTENGFHLEIPICDVLYKENEIWKQCDLIPIVENIIYEAIGKTYCMPLFYEKLKFDTLSIGNNTKESWRDSCYQHLLSKWQKI